MRLDVLLVTRGDFTSRSRAAEAIKEGAVSINGAVELRPAQTARDGDDIVCAPHNPYVSRGALKLAAALTHFNYSATDKVVLDIGASTGGFTQVLLEAGAAHVYAIDVGRDQLAEPLLHDARVSNRQGVNSRTLTQDMFSHTPQAIVCDVSFISLKLALPQALSLVQAGWLVALIKPQFEVGKEVGKGALSRGGIVRDVAAHEAVQADIAAWLTREGWRVDGISPSPIEGAKGNKEFLIGASRA